MSSISWTASTSGSWSDAADWSGGAVPSAGDSVSIGVAGITITVDTAGNTITSLNTTLSTLALTTGGTLFIEQQATLNGGYVQNGGVLEVSGFSTTFNGAMTQTGGIIDVLSGDVNMQGALDILAGTVTGAGTLAFTGGITVLDAGVSLSVANVDIAGGALELGADVTIKSNFVATQAGQLELNGYKLSIGGAAYLGGVLGGGGTVVASGGGVLSNLSLDGAVALDVNSVFTQTTNISAGGNGGAAALLAIGKTGAIDIAGDFGIFDNSGSARMTNKGLLSKIGGGETSVIGASLNSSGTIAVASGVIQLDGPNNAISGAITGAGALQFAGGTTTLGSKLSLGIQAMELIQGATLIEKKSLSFANEWDQTGGVFWLASAKTTLTSSGVTNFDGGLIKGAGAVDISGTGNIARSDIEGVVRLNVTGQIDQTGDIQIGNQIGTTPTVTIASGATWLVENDSNIFGGLGVITNKGTLAKANGSGNSNIYNLLINTGTLTANNGTLSLAGGARLGGAVNGSGLLNLTNGGTYVLASGLVLSTGAVSIDDLRGVVALAENLSYANIFTEHVGTLQLGGNTLTLSGTVSFDGGLVAGGGVIADSGASTFSNVTIGQNAVVDVTGTADQVGDINVGDYPFGAVPNSGATLSIGSSATYTLDDNGSMFNNGVLSVAGTLIAAGSGTSEIDPSVVDNGVIQVSTGEMLFLGNVTGTGSLVIGASTVMAFSENTGFSVAATDTVAFNGTGGDLLLEHPADFAATIAGFATGDVIEVSGLNFFNMNAPVINGDTVTLSDKSGDPSVILTFGTAQTLSSLGLELGPHGLVGLYHT